MYVGVQHRFKDAEAAFARGQKLLAGEGAPPGVRVREFFPGQDQVLASCLWEGGSVEEVKKYVDETLGDSSEQSYFEVNADQALGLPGS